MVSSLPDPPLVPQDDPTPALTKPTPAPATPVDFADPSRGPWYAGVTGYQWLVLAIASAGWMFDVYEGQIFNLTRDDLLGDVIGPGFGAAKKFYGDVFLGIFLLGGTIGGLVFGTLADRFGRRPVMVATILFYSIFSGLTFFATSLWQVAVLRLLVAVGVGGEWAVAAALVAEVFPARARPQAGSIFHASSILGTWLAALAALAVGAEWRYAYLLGVLPALLILGVRSSVREPASWRERKDQPTGPALGSFADLLFNPRWAGRAIAGLLLAAVGLAVFWSVTVAGQDLTKSLLLRNGTDPAAADARAKFAYGIVQAAGGGLGLLSFGTFAQWWGRRATFLLFHVAGLAIVPVACFVPQSYAQMLAVLPFYGFFTLGMHSGYAVYFPELFPTHLRATGTSFCFNGGRLLAVPALLFSGWLKSQEGVDIRYAVAGMAGLLLVGIVLLAFLPETRGRDLPE